MTAPPVLPTVTAKAPRSTSPTKRAVELTTLDVPPQAKHPRGEGSQVDVQSMTVAGTEDEDLAVYFDGHEDVEDLLDPLIDGAEADEMTKAIQKELDRVTEFGVYGAVDLHVALGKKHITTRWELDHRKDGIRARFVAREFNDVFAPDSTPSTGPIIDYLSLKKSYHTFSADVTNAYFHVDDDEECYVDPPAFC